MVISSTYDWVLAGEREADAFGVPTSSANRFWSSCKLNSYTQKAFVALQKNAENNFITVCY